MQAMLKGMGWAMGGGGALSLVSSPATVNNCLFVSPGKGGSDLEGRLGGSNLI